MWVKEEMIYWLKLCNVKGLGPKKLSKLIQIFGSVISIKNTTNYDLIRSRVMNEKLVEDWNKIKNAQNDVFERIIDDCTLNKITIIPLFAKNYPQKLFLLSDPPKNLFCKGNVSLLNLEKIAIVGSRESNDEAKKWAFHCSQDLANNGMVIVSGGAYGIDIEAHKAALSENKSTICVFGTGLSVYYPEEHRETFNRIAETGLILSEHLPSFTGGRIALLQRNRITSGISDAIVQVTSGTEGGSATQLKIALDQRIPVYVPNTKLGFTPFEGVINEVEKGRVHQVNDATDILHDLSIKSKFQQKKLQVSTP